MSNLNCLTTPPLISIEPLVKRNYPKFHSSNLASYAWIGGHSQTTTISGMTDNDTEDIIPLLHLFQGMDSNHPIGYRLNTFLYEPMQYSNQLRYEILGMFFCFDIKIDPKLAFILKYEKYKNSHAHTTFYNSMFQCQLIYGFMYYSGCFLYRHWNTTARKKSIMLTFKKSECRLLFKIFSASMLLKLCLSNFPSFSFDECRNWIREKFNLFSDISVRMNMTPFNSVKHILAFISDDGEHELLVDMVDSDADRLLSLTFTDWKHGDSFGETSFLLDFYKVLKSD